MKGQKLSEKQYELIKHLLTQGYSAKKVCQMLPDEVKVCQNTIVKVNNASTYNEYLGIKPEPDPVEEKPKYVPHAQVKEITDSIEKLGEHLTRIEGLFEELLSLLR